MHLLLSELRWFYPVHVSGWKYCGLKHHTAKTYGTWDVASRILNLGTRLEIISLRYFSAAVPLIKAYGAY